MPNTTPSLLAVALAVFGCRSASNHDGVYSPPPPSPSSPSARAPEPMPTPALRPSSPSAPEPMPSSLAVLGPLAPRRHRVLVIGDSLSDWRVGGGGYLRALMRACPDVSIDNRARGGWMVNQMRRRMEKEINPVELARFSDLVLFGGINDVYSDLTAGRNFEKITTDLSAMYRLAKSASLRVIAVTLSPWGGFTSFYNPSRAKTTRRINDWIEQQQATGLVDSVIDANALLSCGDPERLCPAYAHPIKDGLHFGAKGHERLGESLILRAFSECASATATSKAASSPTPTSSRP